MYMSLEIKGFRCFRHLTIPKLARLNLIGGKNNTGKTALLEAVRVLTDGWSRPGAVVRDLYRLRGLDDAAMKALGFIDIPHGFSHVGEGSVAAHDPNVRAAAFEGAGPSNVMVDIKVGTVSVPRTSGENRTHLLARRFEVSRLGTGTSHVEVDEKQGLDISPTHEALTPCFLLSVGGGSGSDELVALFSSVQVAKLKEYPVAALGQVDSRLVDIAVAKVGDVSLVHADVGAPRFVPIELTGAGMARICSIVLAVCNARGGFVLIDEIENGLHYSVMADVWRAIAQAALDLDVQVFATTHSHECVAAAYGATEEMPEDTFLYHRLDRVDDEIVCQTYSPRGLEIAMATGNEIR